MYFEWILFVLIIVMSSVIIVCRTVRKDLSERDPEPWFLDWSRAFLPVLLIVFLLRSFITEPFRIPSGSMLPTLEVGDFILVNKFTYGIRLPILHTKILDLNEPERGDIMVFRYPKDNVTSYIKRVIGIPGDVIEIRGRDIKVNGLPLDRIPAEAYRPKPGEKYLRETQRIPTSEAPVEFSAIYKSSRPFFSRPLVIKVPEGNYFMMGDNRDNSRDSRSWGFVPEKNIVGKAYYVWMHYDPNVGGGFDFGRVGTDIIAPSVEN